jgi:hypothetical protein
MSSINNISISQLLGNLKDYGELILKIILLYIIVRITSALVVWIWRTLIVPLFRKRAYFYYYQNDGFYNESHPFGLLRRRRNTRWLINDKLVGYVEKRRNAQNSTENDYLIFLKSHGRSEVGQARMEDGVCKIFLNYYDKEGGMTPLDDRPVGFIDNGKIYAYYEDREHWWNDDRLETPLFIGDCECPSSRKGERYPKEGKTKGEKPDEEVLHYIDDERSEFDNGFGTGWPYFRKNCYGRKFVKTRQMNHGESVQDGKRFPYALLCSKLWRFLHVYPTGWDNKAMAWGYGYCTEDWRNPFKQNDDNGVPLICRAAAALLLARYEGFVLDPDEIPQKERRGPIPTVLLSFFIYLVSFSLFQRVAKYLLFPFMGPMLNETVVLIALFFVLWLFIIHPIRLLLMERTDTLESFLEKLNINVGVTGWMAMLTIVSVLGIVASIFWIGYEYFPIYVCALTAIVLNWAVYNARRWPIEGYGISRSGGDKREYHDDDRTEGRRRKQEKLKDHSESENKNGASGLAKDEDEQHGEKVDQVAMLSTPTRSLKFDESLYFDKDKLMELRIQNPSRRTPLGMHEGGYTKTAADMVEQEVRSDNSEGKLYSKVRRMAALINSFSSKNNLSSIEKIQLIMAICQPPNIEYQYDELCNELMIEGHNTGILIEGESAYKDYCRFPTESLHDKRGDCDCHAALVSALFTACGFACCFLVGDTNLGSHAAVGLEITDDLDSLKQYQEAVFSKEGKDYLYVETAGKCSIGHVPAGFKQMLEGEYYPIEPNA